MLYVYFVVKVNLFFWIKIVDLKDWMCYYVDYVCCILKYGIGSEFFVYVKE